MPAYKDKERKSWYCSFNYRDFTGETHRKLKRGFKTQREALAWERDFLCQVDGSLDMSFADFVKLYRQNQGSRIKPSTDETKDNVIETKILPYFASKSLQDITPADVLQWQNVIMRKINPSTGKPYAKSYLKTIHNQLSAIFNHAVRFYHLKDNPARLAGSMGSEKEIEMKFWTKEEYMKFSDEMMDRPIYYYAFEVLYWCGIREGELLGLTPADIDLDKGIIDINKTFVRIKGQDTFQSPKTAKSKRKVKMPDFLIEEIREYLNSIPYLEPGDRIFPFTKSALTRELKGGARRAGVKEIRVHDLRHSHVSLLIDMGFSAVAIANRVGHESVTITYRYAHMFPSVQDNMVVSLNNLKGGDD